MGLDDRVRSGPSLEGSGGVACHEGLCKLQEYTRDPSIALEEVLHEHKDAVRRTSPCKGKYPRVDLNH